MAAVLAFLVLAGDGLTESTWAGAPPPNDDFVNSEVVPDLPFTDSESTEFATREVDEPSPLLCGIVSTVWYSFTPKADTLIVADTLGSDFTTALAAWTDSASGLAEVACANQFSQPYSQFAFQATADQTYFFQVGGMSFGDPTGTLVFNLDVGIPPPNDDFAGATAVASLPFSDSVDTVTASREPDEPRPGCAIGGVASSVWYGFTPDADTILLVADTAGSESFRPVIGVYEGGSLADLAPVACSAPGAGARVGIEASAGHTYFFQVGTPTREGIAFGATFSHVDGRAGDTLLQEPDSSGRSFVTGNLVFSLDSVSIPACPAPQFSVPDPVDDLLYPWLPSGVPDVIAVGGGLDAENFCLTVEFAGLVDPPYTGTDESTFAWILFDTDGDADTGLEGATDFYCPGPSGLGVDTALSMSGGFGTLVPFYEPGVPDAIALFYETSFILSIPLAALGDGPPFGFVLLVGQYPSSSGIPTVLVPSDCVPDTGFIRWPASAGDVSCNGTVNNADAALVLQFDAGLIDSVPCPDAADVNGDSSTSSLDAALILQYGAGLITDLSP